MAKKKSALKDYEVTVTIRLEVEARITVKAPSEAEAEAIVRGHIDDDLVPDLTWKPETKSLKKGYEFEEADRTVEIDLIDEADEE